MDLGIAGRRAFVAGSSSGIGKACAELLAREGVRLFLTARGEQHLAETAREIGSTGVDVSWHAADLSTEAGVDSAFDAALATMGGVDILINNAGGPKGGKFSSLSDADWERAVALTLMSTVRLTRRALPGMQQRSWGRIITIASTSVKQPIEGLLLSNSIRLAVVGFAKTLTTEIAGKGITINTVAPGYTATDRLGHLAAARAKEEGVEPEEIYRRWAEETPLRRIGTAAEIAAAVAFLASEPAAYINGVTLAVDGGRIKGVM
ncbi:MAG TPA: SDR family oxidoreductase [Thermoanaerobaculia bacterium]|nr:SDR family oxidoreductase [Thermoanaerobaculia bacterium]